MNVAKEKINICLFKNNLDLGGSARQLNLLANCINKDNFVVSILTTMINNHLAKEISKDINIQIMKKKNIYSSVIFLSKYINNNSISILHCWDFRSSIIGFFTKFSHCRIILTLQILFYYIETFINNFSFPLHTYV